MAAAEMLPVTIDLYSPKTDALQDRIDPLVVRAKEIEISDQAHYERAADFLRDCKTMQKDIRETMDPAVKKAHEAHKAVTAIRSKLLDPIDEAEKVVKRKMGSFVEEQERAARIERQRIEAEARKAEEDRRLREAEELEARGMPEAAEDVISAPIVLPSAPRAEAPKAEGISSSRRYWAEVTDLEALIRAAAEGKVPAGFVIADQKALDAMARATKDAMKIPGVIVRSEPLISAKGR